MSNITTSSTSTSWPADAIPREWIEKLFKEMLLSYGKKFTEQWAGADPEELKRHWAQKMHSLSGEEMKRGVTRMRERDWPPTLNEFLKLCKPSIDPTAAYYEAVNGVQARERGELGKWSHPAIFWASVMISAFDLKNQSYSQLKGRWEQALQEELEKGEWTAIPEPMIALPEPGKSRLSREQAARMLEQLNATEIIKPVEGRTDHKRWARLILERAKKETHGLSALQIRFAKEALSAK